MNITHPKEWEQYKLHKFTPERKSEDKSYQTFLNSIFNEDGELNKIGGKEIPENIQQLCRVYNPMDEKEYIVYDVNQWGWFEDGTRTPTVHIQDVSIWMEFVWERKADRETLSTTTSPKKTKYHEVPEGQGIPHFELEWNEENLKPLLPKITPMTQFYVYDLGRSGRGGRDGKISVRTLKDLRERSFTDLIEGTYLLVHKLEQEIKATQQERAALETRKRILDNESREKSKEK